MASPAPPTSRAIAVGKLGRCPSPTLWPSAHQVRSRRDARVGRMAFDRRIFVAGAAAASFPGVLRSSVVPPSGAIGLNCSPGGIAGIIS